MFKGVFTAIVTPFKENGDVDYDSLGKIVEFQIENTISGLVPVGTTGESPTLSHDEHKEVIKFVVDKVAKRVPVIAGTGSNSTREAIELTAEAKKIGADASLQVCPYYNKPTQEGIFQHYKAIAEEVDLPLVIYNIPGRTSKNIEVETIAKLAQFKNVVGIKEAAGSISQMQDIILQTPDDFCVLSGDDSLTFPLMAIGGHGVISVASNFAPAKMMELVNTGLSGDLAGMGKINKEMMSLMNIFAIEQNPLPIKTAMALKGFGKEIFRLPMTPMSAGAKATMVEFLKGEGLL